MVATIFAVSYPKSTIVQNPVPLKDPNSNFLGGSLKTLSLQLKPRGKKRDISNLVVASAGNIIAETSSKGDSSRFYLNFTGFPFPLGPFLNRRTIRTEVSLFIIMLVWNLLSWNLDLEGFLCQDFAYWEIIIVDYCNVWKTCILCAYFIVCRIVNFYGFQHKSEMI